MRITWCFIWRTRITWRGAFWLTTAHFVNQTDFSNKKLHLKRNASLNKIHRIPCNCLYGFYSISLSLHHHSMSIVLQTNTQIKKWYSAAGLVWKGTSHYKSSSSWPREDILLNVQVIHRHGDRTPATLLRSDRSIENKLWANKPSKQYSPLRYTPTQNTNTTDPIKSNLTTNDPTNINLDQIYQWNNIAKKLNGTYIVHKEDNYNS